MKNKLPTSARTALALGAAASVFVICATAPAQQPPIRPAEPVNPPPRATPYTPPVAPAVRPPVAPAVTPPAAATVESATPPESTGDPATDLYTYSIWVYSQGHYDIAAQQFGRYTTTHEDGEQLAGAFYYLGESQLKQERPGEAASAFYQVVRRWKEGEFVAPSAYRLGDLSVGQGEFEKAVPYFRIAEDSAQDPQIREAAEYRRAKCLKELGRDEEAVELFALLSESQGNVQIRDDSLRELARLQSKMGNTEEAAASFERLAGASEDDTTGGGALIQAGILQSDNGNAERARELIDQGIAKGVTGHWKASGLYTLLQLDIQAGDFETANTRFGEIRVNDLPEDIQPRVYLLAGHAQRKAGENARAIDHYRTVERMFASSDEAPEAGYFKLLCFYQMGDDDLPDFVEEFVVARATDGRGQEFIDRSLLLRSESYFAAGDYARAAASYSQIKLGNIPEEVQPAMLYNRGWSESEAGNKTNAASTLGRFLELFPQHPSAPQALAARALAYRELNDRPLALADLTRIIEDHPDSPTVELALQQSGLIHGESNEWDKAIVSFKALLEKFPESIAVPEAEFYTGKSYFELKEYPEAIPHLEAARTADSEAYYDMASNLIIYANYLGEDADGLATAVDSYLAERPDAGIGTNVLSWLGAKRYESNNFADAAKYLGLAANPDDPGGTPTSIWLYLAESRLAIDDNDGAIGAARHFISGSDRPSSKGRGHLLAARAELGRGNFDAADDDANEGLGLVKQGGTNAELLLLQGDIALARGDKLVADGDTAGANIAFDAAAAKFVIVSQIFIDPKITPAALDKAAAAYERLGQLEKANQTRAELQAKFPNYTPGQ